VVSLIGVPVYGDVFGAVTFGAIAATTFISIDCFISAGHAAAVNEQRGYSQTPAVRHAPMFAVLPARSGGSPTVMAGYQVAF